MPLEPVDRQLDLRSAFVPADHKVQPPRSRGARTYLAEADAFLHVVPDAVRVKEQLAELHRALAGNKDARSHGPASLTMAELRVLSHLPTHLSLAEIADRLFVTRNTVKSQSISIYRKLGVFSAGPRSRLPATPDSSTRAFIHTG